MRTFTFILALAVWSSCQKTPSNPPLFIEIKPEESGFNFINQVDNTKEFNIFNYRNFYNGGGVAIGDVNNDGLPDIYMTSNLGDNRLFLNKGNFKFEDI
ncbi:MAG: hypothetical protein RLZ62_2145, partial [Bacteroidota bacterium]